MTHWWVLGAVPCGTRDCLSIRTTTNGGLSFRSLPAPGGSFAPTANASPAESGIRFADPMDGWVFGPGLYATHDGGRHWTAIHIETMGWPGTVRDLEPGLGEVYAVVSPPNLLCAKTASCSSGTPVPQLWRTLPWSNDWSVDQSAGSISGSLAVHGRSVWVVNNMPTSDGPAIGNGLLHSADAGNTFALEPQPVTGIVCSYSPVTDSFLWSYCSGGHFMFPFVSSDAGTHFVAVTVRSEVSPVEQPNGAQLAAASPEVAVVADFPAGSLIRTTDGGKRWTVVQLALDAGGNWSLIGFTTPDVGYAIWSDYAGHYQTAQLWRTTNGGQTWKPVTTL